MVCLGMCFVQNASAQNSEPEIILQATEDVLKPLGIDKLLLIQRSPMNPSHVYTYHQEGLAKGGGLWVWTVPKADEKPEMKKILDSPEGIIMDANLHYDGKTILFSWKKTMEDYFQLYTIDIEGNNLKQITTDSSHNFNACWVPDGGIVYLSDRKSAFAYCWSTTTPILWRCERDGSNQIRLSGNYLNDFTPSVMEDGRMLFSRWEYVDRPGIPIQSLWAMFPDGTQLSGIFGNRVLSPATFMDARSIPKSDNKILCVMTSHNGPCRGAIGIVDISRGSNAQEAITNLTPEINIGKVDEGDGNSIRGPYLNPYPVDDNHFLVSKAGQVELRDFAMTKKFLITKPEGLGFYSPQPIRARAKEHLVPSSLPPVEVDTKNGTDTEWATLYMQDVYIGLEGYVKRGEIKKIAVVQEMEKPVGVDPKLRAFGFQFPVVSAGATFAPKKVWGYATVEEDGSAHFKVPAGVPIYFLPLDEKGMAVQRMRTFTHLMPGEKQGCIGCHANRNSLNVTNLKKRAKALLKNPQELEIPQWGVEGFHYVKTVQPVWDRNCVKCHNAEQPSGGLDFCGDKTDFFNVSYDNLVRRGTDSEPYMDTNWGRYGDFKYSKYTSWIPSYNGQESNVLRITPGEWGARASLLAEIVSSGHKDQKGQSRIDLSDDEKRIVYAWLDLNVPYYATSASHYIDRIGCRHMMPDSLVTEFKKLSAERCISCHKQEENDKVESYPNNFFVRIDHPEKNPFLMAPLPKEKGGSGKCGNAIFADKEDPGYKALLKTFEEVQEMLKKNPRMDMIMQTPEPGSVK